MTFLLERTVYWTVEIVTYAIIIEVILSWVVMGSNVFTDVIRSITEPVLKPFRALISKSAIGGTGMRLDFSPILALIALNIGRDFLISILRSL